jgi:5S rRNA maturation endonuclease (ribonuclease M5)
LGYNPVNYYESASMWGLAEGEKRTKVWLAQGIIIPCVIENQIWYLKIRRLNGSLKYVQVKGGRPALFGADDLSAKNVVLLVEGEFDKLISEQVIGDVTGVATFGSASNRSTIDSWKDKFQNARAVLLALDVDDAGRKGGAALMEMIPNAYLVRVPVLRAGDKDLSDYALAGGNLHRWLFYQLDCLNIRVP